MSTITSLQIGQKKIQIGNNPDYAHKVSLNGLTEYTAPSDGWFYISEPFVPNDGISSGYATILLNNNGIAAETNKSASFYINVVIPCNVGDTICKKINRISDWQFIDCSPFKDASFFVPKK